MERLSKEFTDIDEGVTVDEDLMASLKKRMGNSTETKGDNEGSSDGPSMGPGDDPPPVDSPGGGAAVLEPPGASSAGPDEPPTDDPPSPNLGSASDIDALNKMFGMGDAEK